MEKAYLILEDGHVFEGYSFGADAKGIGELVFNTQTVGYVESLTDPAYFGQILMQTFPMVGNYGIMEEDFAGKCALSGYVVREYCEKPSNFRSQYDLDTFLKNNNIPAICGVDTRQITKILRENGTMNACICSEIPKDFEEIKNFKIVEAINSVTSTETEKFASGEEKYNVTVVNYGSVSDAVKALAEKDCAVTVVPATATAEEILATEPDGILLSNGPGDPSENVFCIEQIKNLVGKKPIFGISLGHQLLALADGGMTYKLKYGHRGSNQPVREADGMRTFITAQNHGYAVASDSTVHGKVSFVNVNDNTCEGIEYPELRAFSVQFLPDNWSGERGTLFLYDKFIKMMEGEN